MLKSEAHPGRFLRQDDVSKPILVTILRVEMALLEGDAGTTQKPVAHFIEPGVSPMVINKINWDELENGFGMPDSDDWGGSQCVIYVDPNVSFGGRRSGGLRVRMPKSQVAPPVDPKQIETDEMPDESVPF